MRRVAALAALALGLAAPARAGDLPAYRELEIEVPRQRVALVFEPFDGDRLADLLIARETSFELRLQRPGGRYEPAAVLEIGDSLGGALFDVDDLDGDGRAELYLLHRGGVDVYRYRDAQKDFVQSGSLIRGQRGIAFLHLLPFDFLTGQGKSRQLLFPADGKLYVYKQGGSGDFQLADQRDTAPAQIGVRLAATGIAQRNTARVELPRPNLAAAGAADGAVLRIGKQIAVASEDASGLTPGALVRLSGPADPLEAFRRRHGIELKDTDTFQSFLRDVDGDGRPDYTIVYGNRIWVYKASGAGFDFDRTPDQLLKVSDTDRMLALLLPINDDARPDLVLFKYEQPSFARIVAALAIGLRAQIEVLGYENDGGPVFSRKPSARSTFVVNVPPLLQLASRLEEIVTEFRDAFRPIRSLATGDFDGDGAGDVVRVAASGALELYTSQGGPAPIDLQAARAGDFLNAYDGHKIVRKALFDTQRRSLGIDSALELVRDIVSQVQASVLAGRAPALSLPVAPELARRVGQVLARDLDGDGRDDIVVFPDPPRDPDPDRERVPLREQRQTLHVWVSGGAAPPPVAAAKPTRASEPAARRR